MKKGALLLASMLISVTLIAQGLTSTRAGVSIDLKAGFATTTLNGIDKFSPLPGRFSINEMPIWSLYGGAFVNIPIGHTSFKSPLFIQSGVSFINIGREDITSAANETLALYKAGGLDVSGSYTERYVVSYLQIPVNLITNFKVGERKILVGLGLYTGIALSGTRGLYLDSPLGRRLSDYYSNVSSIIISG